MPEQPKVNSGRRLTRLPPDDEGRPRYWHPHGYVIVRVEREVTGFERVGRMNGQADWLGPVRWWEVFRHIAKRASDVPGRVHPWAHLEQRVPAIYGPRLRDARAWCDANPREGWDE